MSLSEERMMLISYEDFWRYCKYACPHFKTGCADTCELRKRLAIPPFSKSYKGKETGPVKP